MRGERSSADYDHVEAKRRGEPMNVFDLKRNLVDSYAEYIRSFIQIRDARIDAKVKDELNSGLLWPEPLVQLNPSFEPGRTFDELADESVLPYTGLIVRASSPCRTMTLSPASELWRPPGRR